MAAFDNDMDDFWDVSRLVPKKRAPLTQFSSSPKVKDFSLEASPITESEKKSSPEDRKIDFSLFESAGDERDKKEPRSYSPSGNSLIKTVTIKPSLDRFDFYDTFRKAALIYYDYKCPKCDFVPFYSYKPQYSQMTPEQKKYYFFWRDEVRRKRYIKTDYSYIYLYVYEILNLPEKCTAEEGLMLLCDIWEAYRKELPRIDQSLALWVQDYCLVYGLECPFERIKDFLFDVINASVFKEFYLSDIERGGNGAAAMIAYLSDYDWRRGKYAGGDNAEMYRMHVEGAMRRVFIRLLNREAIDSASSAKLTKTAFAGLLCTHTVKCNLEIEYTSIAESPEMRAIVTAAVKYTENKLRACLGVKSRLAIRDLPDEYMRIIDKYFEAEFERLKRERAKANEPEYERLYDAPEEKVSLADAIEIERASWKMTARLVEGTEADEENDITAVFSAEEKRKTEIPSANVSENENESKPIEAFDSYGLSNNEIGYLFAVYNDNKTEIQASVKALGVPEDAVAERINEAFSDNFGDVVLESSFDGGYRVIEDYFEEIGEWLSKTMK
ncbi:MAG: hypothetical protein E7673_02980 [Ruminococcaceae bacterium]|nr:hypothetical protein [Oscillospiraceae bacterium]